MGRRSACCIAIIALLLAAAGCGGDPPAAAPSPTPLAKRPVRATPAAAKPSPVATPQIGGISWATAVDPESKAPDPAVSYLVPDAPRIIAATRVSDLPPGARIEARWEYNKTPLETLTTQITASTPLSEQWIAFQIDRGQEATWPEGEYEIIIFLDGKEVERAAIEVRAE